MVSELATADIYNLFLVGFWRLSCVQPGTPARTGRIVIETLDRLEHHPSQLGAASNWKSAVGAEIRQRSCIVPVPQGVRVTQELLDGYTPGRDDHFVLVTRPKYSGNLHPRPVYDRLVLDRNGYQLHITPGGEQYAREKEQQWPLVTEESVRAAYHSRR